MKKAISILAALVAVSGCASQGALDDKTAEAAACRTELASLRDKDKAELDACTAARGNLQASYDACRNDLALSREKSVTDLDACIASRNKLQGALKDSDKVEQQAEAMKALEGELRDRLKSEIASKDVEIERLRSKLSIHVLNRILFDTGSAQIRPKGRKVLDEVADAIGAGKQTIKVEGHTDDVPIGPDLKKKYYSNWELSAARASSVVRYFQYHHGIDPTRMEAVGFSKYRPVAPNDTDADRQRNRRVEIVLTAWNPATGTGASR